jgi:hypothetical protein
MAIYRVFQRPERPAGEAVFVREGFSGAAMIFSAVWALWNRMWIVAAALVVCLVAFGFLDSYIAIGDQFLAVVNVAFGFVLGLEAEQLRSWSLEHAGYRECGVVQGEGIEDAELKFFMDRSTQVGSAEAVASKSRASHTPDMLGLFGAT